MNFKIVKAKRKIFECNFSAKHVHKQPIFLTINDKSDAYLTPVVPLRVYGVIDCFRPKFLGANIDNSVRIRFPFAQHSNVLFHQMLRLNNMNPQHSLKKKLLHALFTQRGSNINLPPVLAFSKLQQVRLRSMAQLFYSATLQLRKPVPLLLFAMLGCWLIKIINI